MRVSEQVLAILSNQLSYSGNSVAIEGQLERKLYVDVNKVLEACGLEWNRKAKAHIGTGSQAVAELIALVIATGEIMTAKDLGFFPTPPDLASQLVEIAEVKRGDHVLEPSAGEGAIAMALLRRGTYVHCVERDRKRRTRLLACLSDLLGDLRYAASSFRGGGYEIANGEPLDDRQDDFMDFEPEDPFDAVVMNPPFFKVGKGDHIDHVYHALECVRDGGVVVSVMPSGIEFRQDKRHTTFRERMQKFGTITPLPEGSFKSSGTGVNTCVVKVRR